MSDTQYEEHEISKVEPSKDGWFISFGCMGIFCPTYAGEPKVGSIARLYGKGFGYATRGMFIDGVQVYYRTPEEDDEYRDIELYGADAADWVKRWDEGRSIWTIEMGGLGPGYEQCIQITAVELVRFMLAKQYNPERFNDELTRQKCKEEIDAHGFENEIIKALGLSGAQYGAAKNLAWFMYRDGPREVMKDERVKDRHIQVSKNFPRAA